MRDDDVGWMIDTFEGLLADNQRYGLIIMTSGGLEAALTPVQRQRMASWEEGVAHLSKRWNVCTAIVLRSRVQRGFFTAYRWLTPPATPQMVFATLEDAERWVGDMLRSEGLLAEAPAMRPAVGARGSGRPAS